MRPTLLLTRPEAQSRRFANVFRARFGSDWPVLIAPLMEIAPLMRNAGEDADAVILTSANAVPSLAPARGRMAWCVGQATADAALQAGFRVEVAEGDGASLARLMRAKSAQGRLFHAHGRHLSVDLQALMAERPGLSIDAAVVYDQVALPPSRAVLDLLAGDAPVLAPVFSPRSAALLADVPRLAPLWLAAISMAAARAFGPVGRLAVAPSPDAEGVLVALAELLGTKAVAAG